MAATILTRSGSFDAQKLINLESSLRAGLPSMAIQVYGTPTGLRVEYPSGLTAPQITQQQAVINAYAEATDVSLLPKQIQNAITYLNLANPTLAQSQTALRGVIKYLLAQAANKTTIDGTDVS